MDTSEWVTSSIALAALLLSAATAYATWRWRVVDRRAAALTAYFHRNSEMAQVYVGGETLAVGYNLVVWNQGPGRAANVSFGAVNVNGDELRLLELQDGELPLSVLDPGARYPIPWLVEPRERGRHFRCRIDWTDGNGSHTVVVPLRRGETRL